MGILHKNHVGNRVVWQKMQSCQVRQDRLSNSPNYFGFHFILVRLLYGRTKGLCPDPIVGLEARLESGKVMTC